MTKIIIALDYSSKKEAMNLVYNIDPKLYYLKIGNKMFTLFGKKFIYELQKLNFKIFLDLKFFDTPDTIFNSVLASADMGVWMLSIHTSGGSDMLRSAKSALKYFKYDAPLLMGVTILTSFNIKNFIELGIVNSMQKQALLLSKIAFNCNLDGVICPGVFFKYIKNKIININKKFKYVVPGIRLERDNNNDQYNVITPKIARKYNIDYIVLGRTVTAAINPLDILKKIFIL
ncbi:orotidine-5'-phosphate decarboxylase [Buchnera aphidicola (Mollitrichosiphum nigrofasciatum)]|uniref:orotidine-5'-phosphate decarboxylase n=1 Tax=Buchnera aphidicola TaxID=9 RepID=UPI0031B83457